MRSPSALTMLLLCTLATPGTAVAGDLDDPGWVRRLAPIVNGSPATNIPEHRAVVALHVLVQQQNRAFVSPPFCTGTLISDRVVLTAAHCVEENPATRRPFQPQELLIYVGDDPAADPAPAFHPINELALHPGYDPGDFTRIPVNDIAVVVLQAPAPVAPIPPLPRIIGFTGADTGARLNFAGFGLDENDSSGRKLQTDGTLGALGCAVPGCGALGPQESQVQATQLSYTMEESGPCFGDSGGPAFIYRGTRPYVGGVTSYGDEDCTVYGASTRVDAYMEWLRQYIGVDTVPPIVSIVYPAEDELVVPGFSVEVVASDDEGVVRMDLYIDGFLVQTLVDEPWVFDLAPGQTRPGARDIRVVAYDSANSAAASVTVMVDELPAGCGGCAAGARHGGTTLALLALALLLALRPRARRRAVR